MTRSSHKDFISIILVAPYDITRRVKRIFKHHISAKIMIIFPGRVCSTRGKQFKKIMVIFQEENLQFTANFSGRKGENYYIVSDTPLLKSTGKKTSSENYKSKVE